MSVTQPRIDPQEERAEKPLPAENTADRWLVRIAVLAPLVLALMLWNAYGTSLFYEMAAGLWALCF